MLKLIPPIYWTLELMEVSYEFDSACLSVCLFVTENLRTDLSVFTALIREV